MQQTHSMKQTTFSGQKYIDDVQAHSQRLYHVKTYQENGENYDISDLFT